MAFMFGNDEMLTSAIDNAAKNIAYEDFCKFITNVKRTINEFMISSNEKIAKYQSSKVAKQQEIFKEIEKLYIDNRIYCDEVSDEMKNKYVSKYIAEENLDDFKKQKTEILYNLREYKEVLDGMEKGIQVLDKNLDKKVETEKSRREQEKIEAEKRRKESRDSQNSSNDDYYSSNGSDDYGSGGLFGWGIGPF